jgi:hypothetical protein
MDSSAGREGSPRPDRTRCRSRYRRYIRPDLIEVPSGVANTGNVTGGRKSARHYFYVLAPIKLLIGAREDWLRVPFWGARVSRTGPRIRMQQAAQGSGLSPPLESMRFKAHVAGLD